MKNKLKKINWFNRFCCVVIQPKVADTLEHIDMKKAFNY